jgi:hypothetical protein
MMTVSNGLYSDLCSTKMWELFRNQSGEVGSEFKGPRRNRAITNCIIYVFNVISFGYTRLGRRDIVNRLQSISPRQNGMELAAYLVTQNWKAHYWNPDVYHPRDGDGEHERSFTTMALARGTYYDVPLSGLIVGYNKQVKFTTEHRGWIWPFGRDVKVSTEDPANLAVFENLKQVKFAFGVNRGGRHCFLLSYGEVAEAHWDKEAPSLYERKPFFGYEWNSGIILTPPDSTFTSRSIAAVKAKIK